MGLVSWIILGLIAGAIAKLLKPGRNRGGLVPTALLGIAGAVVGGYAGTRLGWGGIDELSIRTVALAVGGALALLIGKRVLFGK